MNEASKSSRSNCSSVIPSGENGFVLYMDTSIQRLGTPSQMVAYVSCQKNYPNVSRSEVIIPSTQMY